MVHYIVIRESTLQDTQQINDVIRNAYLSNTLTSWFNALMKEITFQLIVVFAAIMFIFVGVPFFYCITAIPLVLFLIFITIYSSLMMKAIELSQKRPLQCWVAEVYEPHYFIGDPTKIRHVITTEEDLKKDVVDLFGFRKKVVGTIAVTKSLSFEHSLWLYRLGVEKMYRKKGVGLALIKTVQNWALDNRYNSLHLATAECQDNARYLFAKAGFEVKQMYHKQVLANIIMLVMYQLEYVLKPTL